MYLLAGRLKLSLNFLSLRDLLRFTYHSSDMQAVEPATNSVICLLRRMKALREAPTQKASLIKH